jgi:hypothetical protein
VKYIQPTKNNKMNRDNLQRMADFIRTIPQEAFDMGAFRKGQKITPECDSVGCVIGHCTVLDPNPDEIPRWHDGGMIEYDEWSLNFTGLDVEWDWCFNSDWTLADNSPKGAALRIEWLLNHGLPEDWREQMIGEAPPCYLMKSK